MDQTNRCIALSKLVPWDKIEEKYSEIFSKKKRAPALPLRLALGALLVKERSGFTDEETVEQITENPYLQYFIGLKEYQNDPPFNSSMMVHFRKRLSLEILTQVNDLILEPTKSEVEDETINEGSSVQIEKTSTIADNSGVLLLDATCSPADIRYPTDISLLNESREKLEFFIDKIYKHSNKATKKPRTYRQIARKKPKGKVVRKALKNQLEFVSRDLKHLTKLIDDNPEILCFLKKKEYKDLLVIKELYRQQQEMFDEKKTSNR